MIKVLCLDYDNTVFDHRAGKIPESAEKALEAVRGKCRIVLASGRFFNDVWNAPIKELIKPDGIIHSNGSMVAVSYTHLIDYNYIKYNIKTKGALCIKTG